jgi:hypothetical protein
VMVILAVAMFTAFEEQGTLRGRLSLVLPFAILACCFWAVHGLGTPAAARAGTFTTAAVLGASSLFGWGVVGNGIVDHIRSEMRQSQQRIDEQRIRDEARAMEDVEKFQALPADAAIAQVLPFLFSPNEAVKKECRERLAKWPNLDDELIVTLNGGQGEWAAYYIGQAHPSPSAKLAPAFGQFLDKGLEEWRSTLLNDQYAAKWEPNLSKYVEASRRIQKGGGDLRAHLKPWYDVLSKAPGLGGMAMEIKSIMEIH